VDMCTSVIYIKLSSRERALRTGVITGPQTYPGLHGEHDKFDLGSFVRRTVVIKSSTFKTNRGPRTSPLDWW
jgi:hypothetical protein